MVTLGIHTVWTMGVVTTKDSLAEKSCAEKSRAEVSLAEELLAEELLGEESRAEESFGDNLKYFLEPAVKGGGLTLHFLKVFGSQLQIHQNLRIQCA